MQANDTYVTTGNAPKMHFSDIWGTLYDKIFTFFIFKKRFNVWNQLAPQNNSTVKFSDSVLQPTLEVPTTNKSGEKTTFCYFPA